jgi:hypothetical protein
MSDDEYEYDDDEEEEEEEDVEEYEYTESDDDEDTREGGGGGAEGGGGPIPDHASRDNDDPEGLGLPPPPPPPPNAMLRTSSGREVDASSGLLARQVSYTVVDADHVLARRAAMVDSIIEYGLTSEQAIDLLSKHHWTRSDVMDQIVDVAFANDSAIDDAASAAAAAAAPDKDEGRLCRVCFFEEGVADCSGCGHLACADCWGGYLGTAFKEKGSVLSSLPCFYSSGTGGAGGRCPQRVPMANFERFCTPKQWGMYREKLVEDFVVSNATMAFCPRPNCGRVVSYRKGGGSSCELRDVQCFCGEYFCFTCRGKAHQPLGCTKAGHWHKKEVDEGETAVYLAAHTKACPKCTTPLGLHICTSECRDPCENKGRPAELGCNHFTCKCGHEFCWMCMADWKTHGSATGGYYQCNIYNGGGTSGGSGLAAVKEEERARLSAQEELKRYEHHYSRFKQHQDGVKHNRALVVEVSGCVSELAIAIDAVGGGVNGEEYLQFLVEAARLVGTARQVLMWSYAEAFYLPQSQNEWRILVDQQGTLDKMVNHVQKDLNDWCNRGGMQREKEQLALRRNSEILRKWPMRERLMQDIGTMKKFSANIKTQIQEWEEAAEAARVVGERGLGGKSAAEIDLAAADAAAAGSSFAWQCPSCTFVNAHVGHQGACEICGARRPRTAGVGGI